MNLAISFAAALAWASRALARCASLFRSAVSIASSLRGTSTGEPRRRSRSRSDGVRLHHQHTSTAARHQRRKPSSRRSKAPPSFGLRNAPLVAVDLAVAVRVQLRERRLETRRHQQVLQILIAAVREEVDHFFICSDGGDAARESGGERRVASMAYKRPPTSRHRRDARRLKDGRSAQTSLPCRGSPSRPCQSLGKLHGPR